MSQTPGVKDPTTARSGDLTLTLRLRYQRRVADRRGHRRRPYRLATPARVDRPAGQSRIKALRYRLLHVPARLTHSPDADTYACPRPGPGSRTSSRHSPASRPSRYGPDQPSTHDPRNLETRGPAAPAGATMRLPAEITNNRRNPPRSTTPVNERG